jgi:hypothetical protein
MADETAEERHNRELIEMLNELRVLLPGVQVLFAFLLAVPLSSRFDKLNTGDRLLFFLTLCSTAIAAALLIAPSAIHRLDFRLLDKGEMIILTNRFAIAGTFFVAISMVGALSFVTDQLYGSTATIVVGGLSAILFGTMWVIVPLRWRRTHDRDKRVEE